MDDIATKKIKFLRQYGPIARNDNMYDETIQRAAKRLGIRPITFAHPRLKDVQECFTGEWPKSVVLTGTAGDGKTHLCREVWESKGGDLVEWATDSPYLRHGFVSEGGQHIVFHVIRDFSAWVPQLHAQWTTEQLQLLDTFCQTLYQRDTGHVFLIAANDGQLVESWRRLPNNEPFSGVRDLLETLLVEDRQHLDGVHLEFFNLSRGRSAELFDLALKAFLSHEAWRDCLAGDNGPDDAFGPRCPIRHNYLLLQEPLVQKRLRILFELCDYNDLHLPIRQILLLLTNAVLGHPDVRDDLLVPSDIPHLIQEGTVARASLYNNIFGGNLGENRRQALTIFAYFDRFRIGYETSNRIDNILIFGDADANVRPYFDQLLADDTFYGVSPEYRAAQRAYVEGTTEKEESVVAHFLNQLVVQRRGLFFKIPHDQEEEVRLWDLTVFKYAGDYLDHVVRALASGRPVDQPIRARLVKGLNRIFVGMLINSERELVLASSLSFSAARVNRLLEERISVFPHLGECVEIVLRNGVPTLNVVLGPNNICSLPLYLIRFEYLCRVADGALPSSFSKECYEDMLAFKTQILAGLVERRQQYQNVSPYTFRLLTLDDQGGPLENMIELKL
ncbi:MAG TPA: hypothetical protein VKT82_17040 [Ktedonobacterales bacterium]|nr:hypothetical protein [Ktedonobacterales bacterium]